MQSDPHEGSKPLSTTHAHAEPTQRTIDCSPFDIDRFIHKAIRAELSDLCQLAQVMKDQYRLGGLTHSPKQPNQTPSNQTQTQTHPLLPTQIATRLDFLCSVLKHHSDAEDAVVLQAIPDYGSFCGKLTCEHEKLDKDFQHISTLLRSVAEHAERVEQDVGIVDIIDQAAQALSDLLSFLSTHLLQEEEELLPLIARSFSIQKQKELVVDMMAHLPVSHIQEMIPWLLHLLNHEERESILQAMLLAPQHIQDALSRFFGMLSDRDRVHLAARLPELQYWAGFQHLRNLMVRAKRPLETHCHCSESPQSSTPTSPTYRYSPNPGVYSNTSTKSTDQYQDAIKRSPSSFSQVNHVSESSSEIVCQKVVELQSSGKHDSLENAKFPANATNDESSSHRAPKIPRIQSEQESADIRGKERSCSYENIPLLLEPKISPTQQVQAEHPIIEIIDIHKAIRYELDALRQAMETTDPSSIHEIRDIRRRYQFLSSQIIHHSRTEELIVFPSLKEKVPSVKICSHAEHQLELQFFETISHLLDEIILARSEEERKEKFEQCRQTSNRLTLSLISHLKAEDEEIYPLVMKHFSTEEQKNLVGKIIGFMPDSALREMLPWVIGWLRTDEQSFLSRFLVDITSNTMFSACMSHWWMVEESPSSSNPVEQLDGVTDPNIVNLNRTVTLPSWIDEEQCLSSQENLRKAIRKITETASLPQSAKNNIIQELMMKSWKRATGISNKAVGSEPNKETLSYHNEALGILGCPHYQKKCKIRAACCGNFVGCRMCHDQIYTDHQMNRYLVREMLCMKCFKVQPLQQFCSGCGECMGKYYCNICQLIQDDPTKAIYHCPFCNACRIGHGLGIDYFHCMKCNMCMRLPLLSKHKCIERSAEANCPICKQYMFTSTSPMKVLPCGHVMHAECFHQFSKTDYRCPFCKKTFADTTTFFSKIDALVQAERAGLPSEYRNKTCHIVCNDCEKPSAAPFHFQYHKCGNCRSYNTCVVRIEESVSSKS